MLYFSSQLFDMVYYSSLIANFEASCDFNLFSYS